MLTGGGLAAITTLRGVGSVMQWRGRVGDLEPSVTTELALLLMFGLGAYLAFPVPGGRGRTLPA